VVVRASSPIVFEQGKRLRVLDYPSTIGPVDIVCTTRYLDREPGVTLPGDLCIDVCGRAGTLGEALMPLANAALFVLPILSLSANAAVAEADIELGYDNTPGVTERDYFQSYIPAERGVLRSGRRLDVPSTIKLIEALGKHHDLERLSRAANQYRIALGSWRLGHETLSLAHLWMAVEALTKVKVRIELAARGLEEPADLAAQMGVDLNQLDGVVRKDMPRYLQTAAYPIAKSDVNRRIRLAGASVPKPFDIFFVPTGCSLENELKALVGIKTIVEFASLSFLILPAFCRAFSKPPQRHRGGLPGQEPLSNDVQTLKLVT
jgi:hypothetical protein